jgi:hypothetical protein
MVRLIPQHQAGSYRARLRKEEPKEDEPEEEPDREYEWETDHFDRSYEKGE